MNPLVDLSGKRALVCGATQGIGRAVAELFARLGAAVTVAARDEARLKELVSALDTAAGQTHAFIAADFSRPDDVGAAVTSAIERNGPFGILVNNTGGPPAGLAIDAEPAAFEAAFRLHVATNQTLARLVAPAMKNAGFGRIINIISTSVKEPIPGLGVSNTIRGAVASWAKTLSRELAPFGVTVNNVLPGFTNTTRLRSLIDNRAAKQGVSADEVERDMIASVPLGRFATAEEIAAGVAFLASPAAAYISGVNLPIDGGRLHCL
ncbi:MAG: SDR family oxidoreductase, partial [Phycisphaerales bacterium]|nr:SDR family oxidoreductase [Phycisphaerales bacterium]